MIDFLKTNEINEKVSTYNDGWLLENCLSVGVIHAINGLQEAKEEGTKLSWDNSLEELCEDASKNHFIDIHERRVVVSLLDGDIKKETGKKICDFGASSGYMIEDLSKEFPKNQYIACDLYESGLKRSYKKNKNICHIQLNLTQIPFNDDSLDMVACLNVLEHIEDDVQALKEIYRVMKHGSRACIVVPYGKNLYDYYDESIYHKRRYGKGEMKGKSEAVGFKVLFDNYLGATIYIPFAIKKYWNKVIGKQMKADLKRRAFEVDNKLTKDSSLGKWLMNVEYSKIETTHFPFGIRNIVLLEK